MKREIKNISASIRVRLLNLAKATNRNFNAVLLQYFQERFLYRLSISSYKENFILKGALLFHVYEMPRNRPTKDIDFLGKATENSEENLKNIITEIISIPVKDGVQFESKSISSEIIREQDDNNGIRIFCEANLGQARKRLRFDFGFGDIIIPDIQNIKFPTLLEDSLVPDLRVYPLYTVIAEKFEAIVRFNFTISRMKDFYDIYYLANHYPFDAAILKDAIVATFKNRKTDINNRNLIFSDDFKKNINKQKQWIAFLKRLNIEIDLSFQDCTKYIENFIEPLFKENNNNKIWKTDKLSWTNISN